MIANPTRTELLWRRSLVARLMSPPKLILILLNIKMQTRSSSWHRQFSITKGVSIDHILGALAHATVEKLAHECLADTEVLSDFDKPILRIPHELFQRRDGRGEVYDLL